MSHAAQAVMDEFTDIVLAYGQSDEYSFVLHKSAQLYNRRESKITSNINSLFTASYVMNWPKWFDETSPLKYAPSFDARAVLYPSDENLKDYLSWRQADVHINNLYNTAFWNLVQAGGLTNAGAEERLRGTFSADKNELLFTDFGINYNNEPAMYRKGTILVRKRISVPELGGKERLMVVPLYRDMIQEDFWREHSEIITKERSPSYQLGGIEQSDGYGDEAEDGRPELVRKQIEKLKIRRGVQ